MDVPLFDKGEIRVDYLSEKIHVSSEKRLSIQETCGALPDVTEQIEQQLVLEDLRKTHGNRSRAARTLGFTRQSLLNKIIHYKPNL